MATRVDDITTGVLASPHSTTVSKYDDLRKMIPAAEIYTPDDTGYKESLKRWSASCIKPAAVVVRPNNSLEASVALQYATNHNVYPLAVCGGGHSTSGDSASEGGMVIDLASMRSTTVDTQAQTITFGGGCTWEDVNSALWEHGLATISGTVGDTGVAGLILGGGYGYLTGRHGLALDSLLSCEVVLASGEIAIASQDENPDLFWALRGAGPNFGVVTTFTSQAYPQGEVWAGFLLYPSEKLEALVEFGNSFMETTDGDSMLSLIIGNFVPPDQTSGMLAVVFHNGPLEDGQKIFKPLLDLKPVANTTGMLPYTDLNLMFNKYPRGPKDRHLFGGANFTLPMQPTAARNIGDFFWSTTNLPENANLRTSSMTFEYHPTHKIRQVPIEQTAYGNRGHYSAICITINWTDEDQDANARALSRLFSSHVSKQVGWTGDEGTECASTYANYYSNRTKAEKVYGPNAPRLRHLKQKYDPTMVFKKVLDLSPETSP